MAHYMDGSVGELCAGVNGGLSGRPFNYLRWWYCEVLLMFLAVSKGGVNSEDIFLVFVSSSCSRRSR